LVIADRPRSDYWLVTYSPLILATLVMLVTAPARAATLSFDAASGCPSQEDFASSVERRGGDWQGAEASQRTFEVAIRRENEAYVGTLKAGGSDGLPVEQRRIEAKTCADVVEALAITLALELQGERRQTEPVAAPTARSTVPELSAPNRRVTEFHAASRWGHNVAAAGDGELHFDPKFALTLFGGASFGLLPITTARYDLTFRMASFVTLPSGEQSIIGPILRARVGFVGAPQQTYAEKGTSMSISGQSIGLGLCWSPHYHAGGLVLLACGELGLAGYASHAENRDGSKRDSAVTLLGTVGPVMEAEYGFGPLQLAAKFGGNLVFGRFAAPGLDGQPVFASRQFEAFLMLGLGGHW
jgi:hypothetical protein